ncbi:Retrotransposon gag domain [Sesbania bispinosa]|nr:Retrotransposon gag domain [Sesbania bispinosa]
MAEATRHQAAVREAEERIMAAVNPRFEAMEHQMDDLQELVRGLGMQISELGQNQNQVWRKWRTQRLHQVHETGVSKIHSRRREWLDFQIGRITWRLLVDAMKVRFGAVYEDPMEELVQLRQTGSLSEYQEAFDGLVCKVDLNETQKLSCYVAGLKPEVAVGVKLFAPRSLLEATRLAKLQERNVFLLQNRGNQLPRAGSGKWNGSKIPSFWAPQDRKTEGSGRKEEMAAKISTNSNNQKGILGKPNLKVQQRLSAKELDEHRQKGLCYFCHEKFGPRHDCPQRKKMHVFFMETEEEGEVIAEEDVIEEKEVSVEGEDLVVSMNAIHGEARYPTLRITGWLGKRRIHILEGIGSVRKIKPVRVTAANGGQIPADKVWEGIKWKMQGHWFQTDATIIPLISCDLILGMQWMRGFGKIELDPISLEIEFKRGDQNIKLVAMKEPNNKVVSEIKLNKILVEEESSCMPFTILTDQQSLKHLLEQRLSTPAQYTWVTKLMGLTYDIKYKKGRENVAADALSRASHGQILQMSVSTVSTELWQEIQVAYAADASMHQLKQQIINDPDTHPKYKIAEGVVLRKNRVVIPKNEGLRDIILQWLHSSHVGGHSGVRATKK